LEEFLIEYRDISVMNNDDNRWTKRLYHCTGIGKTKWFTNHQQSSL
jgi:hypothetical protein